MSLNKLKLDELMNHNPESNEVQITNILEAFVWSIQKPTRSQRDTINERIRNTVFSELDDFNKLKRKFYNLGTFE